MSNAFVLCACGCGGALHPAQSSRALPPAQRVSGPAVEPLTLEEAKLHLKVEHAVDDPLIANLITVAREYCETDCERAWAADEGWRQTVDGAPSAGGTPLSRGPVVALSAVTLSSAVGTTQVVAGCRLDLQPTVALVYPPLAGWPAPPAGESWVRTTIDYTAGVAPPPEAIRQAMRLLLGQWYDSRGAVHLDGSSVTLPYGVDALLAKYRATTGVVVPA